MKLHCSWSEKMKFTGEADGLKVEMDAKAPLGSGSALTPKQLLLSSICGCTAMDVIALMKKYKQPVEKFSIDAEATLTEGVYPAVFKEVILTFKLTGSLDSEKTLESVKLSQTKFCGVSAMVSQAVPIRYSVELNGTEIGTGSAQFE